MENSRTPLLVLALLLLLASTRSRVIRNSATVLHLCITISLLCFASLRFTISFFFGLLFRRCRFFLCAFHHFLVYLMRIPKIHFEWQIDLFFARAIQTKKKATSAIVPVIMRKCIHFDKFVRLFLFSFLLLLLLGCAAICALFLSTSNAAARVYPSQMYFQLVNFNN